LRRADRSARSASEGSSTFAYPLDNLGIKSDLKIKIFSHP
jgi:hypothetical protein